MNSLTQLNPQIFSIDADNGKFDLAMISKLIMGKLSMSAQTSFP